MNLFVERGEGGRWRLRALWRLIVQFVVFSVSVAALVSLLAVASFSIRGQEAPIPGAAAGNAPTLLVVSGVASVAAIFLSMWFAGRFLDRRPFADFGFHLSAEWWLDLLFGMVLGAALMTSIFLIELSSGWISVTGTLKAVDGDSFLLGILTTILLFVCVGIYEEMLSRGYQLRNLAEGLNHPALGPRKAVLAAWVLSSSFFGLLHVFNPGATAMSTVNIALAGLLLGIGYVLTGELAIPIGLHITWNFFQGSVYGFPVSGLEPVGGSFLATEQGGPDLWTGGSFGPEAGLLEPLAVATGCLLTMLWVRARRGRLDVHAPLARSSLQRAAGDPEPGE